MAAETKVIISGENRSQQAFTQAEQSLESLERQTRELQNATRATAAALELGGNQAKEAAGEFDVLGRQIFKTSAEAKRLGGVWRDTNGILRETNGQFAKNQKVVDGFGRTVHTSGRSMKFFTDSVGRLGSALGGLAIAAGGAAVAKLGGAVVTAAGRLELLENALVQVQGSTIAASQRLIELDEIARLPGANLEALVRYDARLQAIGLTSAESSQILRDTGQSIVSMGGSAIVATEALEQISQALEKNIVDMRDFRPIIQRVPGFLQAISDVHGVEGSLDGLREATARLGGSVKDALLPVLAELSRRFAAPPPESYVRSIDELQNSYFLLQASIGDKLLPAVAASARGLAELFDSTRNLLEGTEDLTASMHHFSQTVDNRESLIRYIQTLRELRDTQQGIVDDRQWWENVDQAVENVAELNKYIKLYEDALAGIPGSEEALRSELEKTQAAYKERRETLVESLSILKREREENTLFVDEAEQLVKNVEAHIAALNDKKTILEGAINALENYNQQQKTAKHHGLQQVLKD